LLHARVRVRLLWRFQARVPLPLHRFSYLGKISKTLEVFQVLSFQGSSHPTTFSELATNLGTALRSPYDCHRNGEQQNGPFTGALSSVRDYG
jgi:hypothetical protein